MASSEHNLESVQSSNDTRDTSLDKVGGGPEDTEANEAGTDLEREPSKHVHLDLDEIEKLEQQKKAKVFADLVLYDDKGKPYIDVNRLIYKPRKRDKKELKERLSWFFSDVVFISANFMSLICSSYLICLGLSIAAWDTNINTISAYAHNLYHEEHAGILRINSLIGSGSRLDNKALGYSLMIFAAINAINVFTGIFACIYGNKWFLIQHIVLDVLTIVIQIIVGVLATFGGTCDTKELQIFQIGFQDLIHLQASTNLSNQIIVDDQYYASLQLDSIQINMECCGASNWSDYLNPDIVKFSYIETRKSSSQVAKILPYSCCKEQWVRNLQCAEGVHEWASPIQSKLTRKMFQERIHQQGCGPKVWHTCIRLLIMAGPLLMINSCFNTLLVSIESVTVVLQIRSYSTIAKEITSMEESAKKTEEKEHRRLSKGKDALLEPDESRHDHDLDTMKSALEHFRDQLPPPTEDEIAHIKTRTAFQQFEKKLNRTALGKMMQKIRRTVTDVRTTFPKAPRDLKAFRESLIKKRKHHHRHYKDLADKPEKVKSNPSSIHSHSASTLRSDDDRFALRGVPANTKFKEQRAKKKPKKGPMRRKPSEVRMPVIPNRPRATTGIPSHVISRTPRIKKVPSHVILSKSRKKVNLEKKKGKKKKKQTALELPSDDIDTDLEPSDEDEEDVMLVNEGVQTSTAHVPKEPLPAVEPEPPAPAPEPPVTEPVPPPPPPPVVIPIEPEPAKSAPTPVKAVTIEAAPPPLKKRNSYPDTVMKPNLRNTNKRGFLENSSYDTRTGLIKEKGKRVGITVPSHTVKSVDIRKGSKKATMNKYTTKTQIAIQDLLKQTTEKSKKKSPSKKKLPASKKSKPKKKGEPKPVIRTAW